MATQGWQKKAGQTELDEDMEYVLMRFHSTFSRFKFNLDGPPRSTFDLDGIKAEHLMPFPEPDSGRHTLPFLPFPSLHLLTYLWLGAAASPPPLRQAPSTSRC